MADIQSNIQINIQTQSALDNLKALQAQLSAFHTSMSRASATTAAQASGMQQNLINSINSTGKFSASFATVATTTQQFTTALEKNKLSLREYFRYSVASSKSFGQAFKTEFDTINRVAIERVKDLQTQYIKLGTDANGAIKTIKVRPLTLDMQDLSTKTQIAAQRQQVLNKLLDQGSTNLLNFGKNTQWAGRQLMVGFTLPLSMFAGQAIKAYSDLQKQVVDFQRVYGNFSTSTAETQQMSKSVLELANSFTQYGVAVKDTMDMAATAAATGKMGADLIQQVNSATKLAVLGGVSQQESLQTTISLTNAFNISSKNLGSTIDYLNAVENQTVLSISDLTTAIPKAAPVVKSLGGDVKDLAFFLTAMKEGGINASQGANALKSALGSIINPTAAATKMLSGFGINITDIVNKDKGNLRKTVMDLAGALDTLDPLNRSKAIEQMFGKFQYARVSTLFKNIVDPNSQAGIANSLSNQTPGQLAQLSQKEMQKISSSPLYQFQKSMQDFQTAIAPIGETFLKVITPIMNGIDGILKAFNGLPDGIKQGIVTFTAIVAGLGPVVLMTFGLVANGVANVIKGFAKLKNFFNNITNATDVLGEQTSYMTQEQLHAAAAAASLDQVHQTLKQTFTTEALAVDELTQAYKRSIAAQQAMGGMPVAGSRAIRAFATGGVISGPGTGTSDSILARLSNGEAVIPAKSVAKHPDLVNQLIGGNLPGYATGGIYSSNYTYKSKAQLEREAQLNAEREARLNSPEGKLAAKKAMSHIFLYNPSIAGELTKDSPIVKRMMYDQNKGPIYFVSNMSKLAFTGNSPELAMLRSKGLRANRYETVPSSLVEGLGKVYNVNEYGSTGEIVKKFATGGIIGKILSMFGESKQNSSNDIVSKMRSFDKELPDIYTNFMRSNPALAIRMRSNDLLGKLASGDLQYRNKFAEPGTPESLLNDPKRLKIEQNVFGIPMDAPGNVRPIYGTAATTSLPWGIRGQSGTNASSFENLYGNVGSEYLDRYGDISLLLKDSVKKRSTFTLGDTFSPNNFQNNENKSIPAPFGTRNRSKILAAMSKGNFNSTNFIEAQIFGGLSFEEVKKIIVQDPLLIPVLEQALAQAGLNVPVTMRKLGLTGKIQKFLNRNKKFKTGKPMFYYPFAKPGEIPPGFAKGGVLGKFNPLENIDRRSLNLDQMKKEKLGLIEGGFRNINGKQHYIKNTKNTADATTEFLMSELRQAMGISGNRMKMFGPGLIGSEVIPGLISTSSKSMTEWLNSQPDKEAAVKILADQLKNFSSNDAIFNALIGNTDNHHNNTMFDTINKKIVSIDLGKNSAFEPLNNTDTFQSMSKFNIQSVKNQILSPIRNQLYSPSNKNAYNDFINENGIGDIYKPLQTLDASSHIDKMAELLGFDLSKDFNENPINLKENPFFKSVLAKNPELENVLVPGMTSKGINFGHSLKNIFQTLKNAKENPNYSFATGGFVNVPGYSDGGIFNVFKKIDRRKLGAASFNKTKLGGSPGGLRNIDGEQYYVKQGYSPAETTSEILASELYNALGNQGARLQMFDKRTMGSKIIPGLIPSTSGDLGKWINSQTDKHLAAKTIASALKTYMQKDVPFNAMIGNIDTHAENILFDPKTKKFVNLDLGNSALAGFTGLPQFQSLAYDDASRMKQDVYGAIKDVIGKNGLDRVTRSLGISRGFSSTTHGTNASAEIDRLANLLGFDLSKTSKTDSAANLKNNKFIQKLIADNPGLADNLDFGRQTSTSGKTLQESFQTLFTRMKKAKANPYQFFANGGVINGPGTGTSDSILARVSNGEAIIPAKSVAKHPQLVNQLVSGNIPGFARGRLAIFPGGSQQSHFDGTSQMTGSEIMQYATAQASSMSQEESKTYLKTWQDKLKKQAEKLGISFEEVLEKEFKVFNNKVVTMSAELNNLLKPSSGGIKAGVVQQEFAAAGKEVHAFARLQLEKMGVAPEEISKIIDQLANATNTELAKFEKETVINEEQLSSALQAAYTNVSASSDKLKSAFEKMSTWSYFEDLAPKVKGSGGTRIRGGVPSGVVAYRGSGPKSAEAARKDMQPGQDPYYLKAGRIYYQNDIHKNIHDTLAAEDPATLKRIGKLKDKEAKLLELEAVAIQKGIVTEEQLTSAKQIQVSTQARKNSNKSLEIVGQTMAENAESSIAIGAEKNLDMHSPSRRLMKVGENAGEGFAIGISNLIPKTKKAGEAFGLQFAKQATVISPAMRQYLNEWGGKIVAPYLKNIKQASLLSVKILTEEEKINRKAIMAEKERLSAIEQNTIAEQTNVVATQESTLAKEADAMASGTKGGLLGKINMGGKLGGAAMMASMILPMLGSVPGMGGIANDPTINGILGTVSTLGMMGQFMPSGMGKIGGKVLSTSAKMGSALPGAAGRLYGGVAGGLAGDIGAGATAAEATGLGVGTAAAEGGLGAIAVAAAPVALALGGVALAAWGAYSIYQKIQDDQKKLHESIYGLGEAATTTKEELKNLGNAMGFTANTSTIDRLNNGVNSSTVAGGKKQQDFATQLIQQYKTDPQNSIIANQYQDLIQTLKDTKSGTDVSNTLKTKELSWISAGMNKQDARSLADAIKILAGKASANTGFSGFGNFGNGISNFLDTSGQYNANPINNLYKKGKATVSGIDVIGGFDPRFSKINKKYGYDPKYYDNFWGRYNIPVQNPTNDLLKARSTFNSQMASNISSVSNAFDAGNGIIKADIFNKSMKSIAGSINSIANKKEAANDIKAIMLSIFPQDKSKRDLIGKIKDTSVQVKAMVALATGQNTSKIIGLIQAIVDPKTDPKKLDDLNKLLDKYTQAVQPKDTSTTGPTAQDIALNKIAAKQTLYSNAQTLLQMKEDKINTAYSERLKALDSIQRVNQQIVQSQKDQLGLATALSQGDIAAAAAAAQQMRANNASSSFQNQQQALQDQQANAIANATVKIGKKTYTGSQLTDIMNKLQVQNIYTQNPELATNKSSGGMIGYYASGTMTPIAMKAKGSDVVPAMLSAGEFVVSAPAVKRFGAQNLKAINSGNDIPTGDSVYNYSISVNVSSQSDPKDIANAVLQEIRRIDSQQVRSGRF